MGCCWQEMVVRLLNTVQPCLPTSSFRFKNEMLQLESKKQLQKEENSNVIAINEKMVEIHFKQLRLYEEGKNEELTYAGSKIEHLSGNKSFAGHSFHQKLMKTKRGFPRKYYYPLNNHGEPNVGVRRGPLVCCKVGSVQNI